MSGPHAVQAAPPGVTAQPSVPSSRLSRRPLENAPFGTLSVIANDPSVIANDPSYLLGVKQSRSLGGIASGHAERRGLRDDDWGFVGIGVGLLVVVIRVWGGLPEGVMYAILLMNAMTPFINRATQPRVFGSSTRIPS